MSFENKGSMSVTILVTSDPDRSGNLICDGTADETEINLAFTYLTTGRTKKEVVKLIGDFTIDASINVPSYAILDLTEAEITTTDNSIPLIRVDGANGAEIIHWEIWGGHLIGLDGTDRGVYVDFGDHWFIDGLAIDNTGGEAIYVEDSEQFIIRNCEIGLNDIITDDGIYARDGWHYTVENNFIVSEGSCIIVGAFDEISYDVTIRNNDLSGWVGNGSHGIYVTARTGNHGNNQVVLAENNIHDDSGTGGTGIECRSNRVCIVDNKIHDLTTYGIHVKSSTGDLCELVTVRGNILHNDDTATAIHIDADDPVTQVTVVGNIIEDWQFGITLNQAELLTFMLFR